ncbi:unnamed protein product [Rotaria sordida]|uniref:Replication-associated protein n=1 Tax=Rotaria sordida TaxID=392033 RepID=A0A819Q5V1_9BILA|nr:unnamed protein product [Rotaria sordida]CAF1200614.1 unnamed protein product [Rotaria sordida]CAF4021556.1 unnamed protein product [Rotaria sordida]CAF4134589.1 unnamed protein product [Rotaria sordida]
MDIDSSSISQIDVQNDNPNIVEQSTCSFINYAVATTAPQYNQPPPPPPPQPPSSGCVRPIINQKSVVETHHHSFNPYRHKDKNTIARENHFDLKDGDYVEFGSFNCTNTCSDQYRSPTSTNSSINNNHSIVPPQLPRKKRMTVRAQADERRKQKDLIADKALTIAEKNVSKAMKYVRKKLPNEFMQRSENCLKSFNYVHKEAQEKQQNIQIKEYIWDLSFPNCTKQLYDTVTDWITNHFRNPHRPKCLILIGPTGVGKTSFALSLPGKVCYFKGRWSLSNWCSNARYLVFDDIPWDDYEKLNFPNKKDLLTANGRVSVTDKYQPSVTIDVTMPSIVLLNPGDEGSLTSEPVTRKQQHDAEYWARRAVVYQMGSDEYFYQVSSASSTMDITGGGQTRPLLGHANEFQIAQQQWLEANQRRRAAAVVVVDDDTDQSDTETF